MSGTVTGAIYGVPGYTSTVLEGVTDGGIFGSVDGEGFYSVEGNLTLIPGAASVLGVNVSGSTSYGETGSGTYFIDQGGTFTVLPATWVPVGVDNGGDVLIDVVSGSTSSSSFLVNDGTITPIGVPGSNAVATAISPSGVLAGAIGDEYDASQYFVGRPGNFSIYNCPDEGFTTSQAPTAVNDAGEVALHGTGEGYAAVMQDGNVVEYYEDPHGAPEIVALNSSGDALVFDAELGHAGYLLIPADGGAVITVPGLEYESALGMNDAGEIVGNGYVFEGTYAYPQFSPAAFIAQLPCFAAGMSIATPGGDVPVETLRADDVVTLADGASAKIIWVGHRRAQAGEIVRVRAGALAPGVPTRDLLITGDHAILLGGVLVPAGLLANDETITRELHAVLTVHHVELERHAILLANGAPCESYLDTGNRAQFGNCPMTYDAATPGQEPCAELVVAGERLQRARRLLPALV